MGCYQSHRQITAPRVLHTVVLDVRYYGSMWAVSFSLTVLLTSHLRFSGLEAISLNFLPSEQPRIVFGTVNTYSLVCVLSCGKWSPVTHTSVGYSAWSYCLSLRSFSTCAPEHTYTSWSGERPAKSLILPSRFC